MESDRNKQTPSVERRRARPAAPAWLKALAAAALLTGACSQAGGPAEAAGRPAATATAAVVVVADGRDPIRAQDLAAWAARRPLQQAARAARAHWRGARTGYEEAYRVISATEGAFTRPGARQHAVLYVMSLQPRCCPKLGLALVENDALVGNFVFERVAQKLSTAPDLDGDGLNELALMGTYGMGGDVENSLTLLSLGTGAPARLGGTSLGADGCAAMRPGAEQSAVRVLARPGTGAARTPELVAEPYVRGCEASAWRRAGEAERLTLEARPGPDGFLALGVE